eukprot:TRINITY_DN41617_c0_g3_i3.p1 TRINITY_DN41617_c0_g3~~TRINITY_DN41617_c0_g3_i3.p1  ORF type:complete len:191 (-),score=50.59 TRINITY_DN41617_c0_g3_i3:387-959(-)
MVSYAASSTLPGAGASASSHNSGCMATSFEDFGSRSHAAVPGDTGLGSAAARLEQQLQHLRERPPPGAMLGQLLQPAGESRTPGLGSSAEGWQYWPHASGDLVDAAVAALVNEPGGRYRSWRALLCRLEQGVYLCGTRRVLLRVDSAAKLIEASQDGGESWADLEALMQGAEASQCALLERARDAAGLMS